MITQHKKLYIIICILLSNTSHFIWSMENTSENRPTVPQDYKLTFNNDKNELVIIEEATNKKKIISYVISMFGRPMYAYCPITNYVAYFQQGYFWIKYLYILDIVNDKILFTQKIDKHIEHLNWSELGNFLIYHERALKEDISSNMKSLTLNETQNDEIKFFENVQDMANDYIGIIKIVIFSIKTGKNSKILVDYNVNFDLTSDEKLFKVETASDYTSTQYSIYSIDENLTFSAKFTSYDKNQRFVLFSPDGKYIVQMRQTDAKAHKSEISILETQTYTILAKKEIIPSNTSFIFPRLEWHGDKLFEKTSSIKGPEYLEIIDSRKFTDSSNSTKEL